MTTRMTSPGGPRVAVFGPNPLLTVTIEPRPAGRDDVHLHPGGQGVWVSRMAAEMGAEPVLCGFAGGETGEVLKGLLKHARAQLRLVNTAAPSGSYVLDRRDGERRVVAAAPADPPTRHELDNLFSICCAAALDSSVLVVCNPYPGDTLPLTVYGDLVADARANGVRVIVDLSTPRLDSALEGAPDLVKLNDWELAEYVVGPVSTEAERGAAVGRLLDAGASSVLVTRGEKPAFFYDGDAVLEIVPPRFDRGHREGCGDSMAGALAAAWARGIETREALRLAAAAGAANFLRQGLGSGGRPVVEDLAPRVEVRQL